MLNIVLLYNMTNAFWAIGAALSYKYQNRSDKRYPARGSCSADGNYCGIFCILLNYISTYKSWYFGATISYKFIKIEMVVYFILFEVVILMMVIGVELFILNSLLVFLIIIGVMVLL